MDYLAKEILEQVIKKIAQTTKEAVFFDESVSSVFTRDYDERESSLIFDSAYIIEVESRQFLVAFGKITGRDDIRGYRDSGIVIIDFQQEISAVKIAKTSFKYFASKKDPSLTMKEYLLRQFKSDPDDMATKARLLLEDFRCSGSVILQSSDFGELCIDSKNRLMSYLAKQHDYGSYLAEEPKYHNDVFLPTAFGGLAIPSSTIKYNEALSELISGDIVENITRLAQKADDI